MDLNQIVNNAIYGPETQQFVVQVINILKPYLISGFVLLFVGKVTRYTIGHGVRDLSLICGDTKRVANKHAKTAQDIYDVATSVNEIRKKENMDPIENGDVYLIPKNMGVAGSKEANK